MFSRLLAGPAVPADQRSVVPTLRGVPWWGAVLIAVGITTIGAVIDAESASTLGRSFKVCYLLGCLLAALLVRQRALFTAAAQPPLVAFVVGIVTLYTTNSGNSQGLRAVVLKVVLPIASSFPWILLAFLMTLAVVVTRWFVARPSGQPFFGKGSKRPVKRTAAAAATEKKTPVKKTADQKTGERKTAQRQRPEGQKDPAKKAASTRAAAHATPGTGERPVRRRPASTTAAATSTRPAPRQRTADPAAATQASPREAAPRRAAPRTATPRTNTGSQPAAQPAAPRSAAPKAAPRKSAEPAPERRRAAPQTIPARDPSGRRRTAGQMRDKAPIEDLTTGADER